MVRVAPMGLSRHLGGFAFSTPVLVRRENEPQKAFIWELKDVESPLNVATPNGWARAELIVIPADELWYIRLSNGSSVVTNRHCQHLVVRHFRRCAVVTSRLRVGDAFVQQDGSDRRQRSQISVVAVERKKVQPTLVFGVVLYDSDCQFLTPDGLVLLGLPQWILNNQ